MDDGGARGGRRGEEGGEVARGAAAGGEDERVRVARGDFGRREGEGRPAREEVEEGEGVCEAAREDARGGGAEDGGVVDGRAEARGGLAVLGRGLGGRNGRRRREAPAEEAEVRAHGWGCARRGAGRGGEEDGPGWMVGGGTGNLDCKTLTRSLHISG